MLVITILHWQCGFLHLWWRWRGGVSGLLLDHCSCDRRMTVQYIGQDQVHQLRQNITALMSIVNIPHRRPKPHPPSLLIRIIMNTLYMKVCNIVVTRYKRSNVER
ncbi:uncharacterized protein BO97DRAFT_183545 [Aspergillus homomorphus CBS 101889]|uniref:Uncharacterized protein n=1 Tax=Aspergillus homomorphus (strain CBS 101889) TaxID=1450537 RepID=A0A395I8K0_ASPHC|nr:hypothetical protein BO97DRAFT_183545 [Aspergillus homomorphus CBS 101889]RAL16119.1 hypothetical protein BO97DRAFT_183545 [Aspergillus homomorphus CBS 101889]